MYLLPKEHPITKKIIESTTPIHCDLYTENANDTTKQQIDEFIRFIEQHLNKIRKVHCQRTTRVSINLVSICPYPITYTKCNFIFTKTERITALFL